MNNRLGWKPFLHFALLLMALSAIYACNVHQFYFLGDDSFISFRYSENLVRGHGLVWNPGYAVEGYTNFSWVLLMALSLKIGVPPEFSANALGILSGSILLLLMLRCRANELGWRHPIVWLPLFILALSISYTAWSTGGLETMLFAFLVFLAFERFLSEQGRQGCWPLSSVIFALAALTRPEGGIFMFIAGLYYLWAVVCRRHSFGSLVIWCLPFLLIVGCHFAWRYSYYGFLLPNTFYAKVAGAWLDQGLKYFGLFASNYQIGWFLPLLLLPLIYNRSPRWMLYILILVIYLSYVLYVGGDRFEFRFLVPVFPYFYLFLAEGIRLLSTVTVVPAGKVTLRWAAAAISFALLGTTYWASTHPFETHKRRYGIAGISEIAAYAERRVEEGKFLRKHIDAGNLPQDLVLCVGGAGAVPYYTMWTTVDRRGLNDIEVARMPLASRGLIAHERDAPYEYLLRRKVAVFDITNIMIHDSPAWLHAAESMSFEGHEVPLRGIKLDDRYMIFATLVSDEELRQIFAGHKLLIPPLTGETSDEAPADEGTEDSRPT